MLISEWSKINISWHWGCRCDPKWHSCLTSTLLLFKNGWCEHSLARGSHEVLWLFTRRPLSTSASRVLQGWAINTGASGDGGRPGLFERFSPPLQRTFRNQNKEKCVSYHQPPPSSSLTQVIISNIKKITTPSLLNPQARRQRIAILNMLPLVLRPNLILNRKSAHVVEQESPEQSWMLNLLVVNSTLINVK